MNLAFNELKYYKFKYLLIALILFLLAFLVMFVSSLAQGLGKDNISFIEQLDTQHIIINKDADHQLNASALTDKDIKVLDNHNLDHVSMNYMTLKNNDKLAAVYTNHKSVYDVKDGRAPESKNEMMLDGSLENQYKIGQTVKLKNKDTKFKITGFTEKQMFAHTSVAFITEDGMKEISERPVTNIGLIPNNMNDNEMKDIKSELNDAVVISDDQMMKGIPSYEAEQMPLNLMVFFLFLISAIVISVFFYVITIQKTREYGILKAIGTKNSKIIKMIFAEVFTIVLVSVLIALAVIMLIAQFIPASMPFFLNQQLVLILVGLFILVALIGALLSIIKVIKIDPIEAIGGE